MPREDLRQTAACLGGRYTLRTPGVVEVRTESCGKLRHACATATPPPPLPHGPARPSGLPAELQFRDPALTTRLARCQNIRAPIIGGSQTRR
jgi:hypothetical protein